MSTLLSPNLMAMLWNIDEPGDVAGALQHLTGLARQQLSADSYAAFALNHITERFVPSIVLAEDNGRQIEPEKLDGLRQASLIEPLFSQRLLLVEDLAQTPAVKEQFTALAEARSCAAISLLTQPLQKPLAVLYFAFNQPRQFGPDEQQWLELFVQEASRVLQHFWLVHRFQEVARIGREINQEIGPVDEFFKKLQKQAGQILDLSHFFMLAIYQAQSSTFDLFLSERGQFRALPNNPLNGGYGWILQEQQSLLIPHLSAEPERLPAQLEQIPGTDLHDRESMIFVPLIAEGVPLGLLSAQHAAPQIYGANDLRLLELLGNHTASSLKTRQTLNNLRQLNHTGQLLTHQLSSAAVLQNLVNQMQNMTKADLVILFPYKQANQQFEAQPYLSGSLLETKSNPDQTARLNSLARLVLNQPEPIFAEESPTLYETLRGQAPPKGETFAGREQIRSVAAVPLRVVNESVGVLFVNFRRPQQFDTLTQELIKGLANYAAIAVKNAREFGSLAHRHLEELEILREIDRAISQSLDLQQVLQTILDLTIKQIPADKAAIFLYNPRTKTLERQAVIGHEAASSPATRIPLEEKKGITRWVFEYKKPVRVGNVGRDPNWRDIYIEGASNILAELDVPLLDGDDIVGIINFESLTEGAFSQKDEDLLVTLANQAVLAIKNAQAYEAQKRLVRELNALKEIGDVIIRHLDSGRVFDLILTKALEITHAEAGTLALYDPQRGDLWLAAERGVMESRKGSRHGLHEGITGWVAREKRLLNVDDITRPPWDRVHLPFIPGTRSEIAVPLVERDNLRGVINVESPEPEHFSAGDERLLTEFADLAVIGLQNAERYKEASQGRARLEALHTIDRKIIGQLDDFDEVVRAILENARDLTGSEVVGLHLYEANTAGAIYRARMDDPDQDLSIQRFDPNQIPPSEANQGIVNHVSQTRTSYRTRGDAQQDRHYRGGPDIHSEIAVPLLSGPDQEELVGILNLESPRPFAFDDDDVWLMELFANQMVIAIQNARSFAQANRRARRFRLLHQAAQKLGEITALNRIDDAYDIVGRVAADYSHSQVIIRRYDEDTDELVLQHAAQWRKTPQTARVKVGGRGIGPQVARERRTVVVSDVNNPPPDVPDSTPLDPRTRSLVIAPIQIEDDFYGNLALIHEKANYFVRDSDDVKLIEGLAGQLAITIHRVETVQAHKEAEQRAATAEVMGQISSQAFQLAHRLGNDLGLIRSYVNNIRQALADRALEITTIDHNLRKINRDVRRVLQLSRKLKDDMAEFRTGQQPVAAKPTFIPPAVLLEDAAQTLPATPENVQIHFDVVKDVAQVYVMPNQITAILESLLTNAIEAMPTGGAVTLRARNTGRRYVEIEVADTGIGIEPEKREQVFDFLYSTKDSSGFGLWNARRLALENGGELLLTESKPGQGTTFSLHLPRQPKYQS